MAKGRHNQRITLIRGDNRSSLFESITGMSNQICSWFYVQMAQRRVPLSCPRWVLGPPRSMRRQVCRSSRKRSLQPEAGSRAGLPVSGIPRSSRPRRLRTARSAWPPGRAGRARRNPRRFRSGSLARENPARSSRDGRPIAKSIELSPSSPFLLLTHENTWPPWRWSVIEFTAPALTSATPEFWVSIFRPEKGPRRKHGALAAAVCWCLDLKTDRICLGRRGARRPRAPGRGHDNRLPAIMAL
jgi:hypothetical protein